MKTILPLFCALSFFTIDFSPAQAAPGTTDESGIRLTIELRDGSRIVGKTLDDTLSLRSAALGDMQLSWAGIRSLEYAAGPDTARLTATNGDAFTVQLAKDTLSLVTGFGKTELAVKLIKTIKVTPPKLNAAATPTIAAEAGSRLTIELRDGSHVVGKGLDDNLSFHSSAMGDLKLTWAGIRSLEYPLAGSDTARLTATNGDVYEVQFAAPVVRVETSFGKNELPVKLIRSLKVSAMTMPGQLPSGLVALWSGEGDGNDSVGGNNMTMTDISFAEGKVGQAFSFNGTSSTIKIPASPVLDVGAGDGLTIMAWIKPTEVDGLHPMFEWPDDSKPVVFEIGLRPSENGVLMSSFTDADGGRFVVSRPGTLTGGIFQHIAYTYDKASGTGTLYLNGVIVAQRQLSGRVRTKGDLLISHRDTNQGNWSSNRSYAGLMDEIAIYNRALSASEIQAVVADQSHGEPLSLPAPSTGWFESWMR